MGFFSTLFGRRHDGRFQTDEAYAENRAQQLSMTPQTMARLRNYAVTEQTQLKLEYFFYTNMPKGDDDVAAGPDGIRLTHPENSSSFSWTSSR